MQQADSKVFIIAAVVAVLLQVIIAPFITVGPAMPNFILSLCLVYAILRPEFGALIMAFVLGLVYNLIAVGPIGAMAFSLVLIVFFITKFFSVLDSGSALMPIIAIAISSLLVELVYAFFVTMFSLDVGLVQAFVYRALPCTVYDIVVGIIVYVILRRLSQGKEGRAAMRMPR